MGILCPELFNSMLVVCAHRGSMANDITKVAFSNAVLSSRGAIRKAHDTATWLSKLQLLVSRGLKADQAIKLFNEQATRESQLQGQKRVALLALLQAPTGTASFLLNHASEFGSSGAFSEECFANKTLFPGYQPKAGDKAWQKRLTVTENGFLTFLQHVDQSHRESICKGKWPKEKIQEHLLMAQLVITLEQELSEMGISSSQKLKEAFLGLDSNLELDLQVAISEKASKFKLTDIRFAQDLIKSHSQEASSKFTTNYEKKMVAAGELEREEFDLMKQMFQCLRMT